jgi:hypothetical protein
MTWLHPCCIEDGLDLAMHRYLYDFLERNYQRLGVSPEEWDQFLSALRTPNQHCLAINMIVDKKSLQTDSNFVSECPPIKKEVAQKVADLLHEPFLRWMSSGEHPNFYILLLDKALIRSRSGIDSIFDLIDLPTDHPFAKYLKKVLIYCPFEVLKDRIAERNRQVLAREAEPTEMRIGTAPLIQYASLIRPREFGDDDSQIIDRISRRSIEECFEQNFHNCLEALKGLAPDYVPQFLQQKASQKQELFKALKMDETIPLDQVTELVPRANYDMIINTNHFDPTWPPALRSQAVARRIFG